MGTNAITGYNIHILFSRHPREACAIARCSQLDVWLHVVLPACVAIAVLAALFLFVCIYRRRGRKKTPALIHSTPTATIITTSSSLTNQQQNQSNNYSEMEMSSLLLGPPPPPASLPPPMSHLMLPSKPLASTSPPAREFPITSVRFNQELGEGSFGKVYKGDLGGIVGGCGTQVRVYA